MVHCEVTIRNTHLVEKFVSKFDKLEESHFSFAVVPILA